jgi:hypothetical protein
VRVVIIICEDDETSRCQAVTGTLSSDTVDVGESIAESRLDKGVWVDLSSAAEE